MDMLPRSIVVDGCVSWVPGMIVDISVVDLIEVSSTGGCSDGWGGCCLVRWWV